MHVQSSPSDRAVPRLYDRLPTSVGIGPTKTLAKLANHVTKTAGRKPGSYPHGRHPTKRLS